MRSFQPVPRALGPYSRAGSPSPGAPPLEGQDASHPFHARSPSPGPEPGGRPHTILLEVLSEGSEVVSSVLEVAVVPQPIIVDRTFRFYASERELMRQVKNRPFIYNPGFVLQLTHINRTLLFHASDRNHVR